jgi:peptidyl-prolyl cis-trans isomerase B (cyclophilin B)
MHRLLQPIVLAALLAEASPAAAQAPALSVQLAVASEYTRDRGPAEVKLTIEAKDRAEVPIGWISGRAIEAASGSKSVPLVADGADGKFELAKGAKLSLELPFDIGEVMGRLGQRVGLTEVAELVLSLPGQPAKATLKVVRDLKEIGVDQLDLSKTKVVLVTNFGPMTVGLLADKAPKTAANFVKLAKDHFYDGTKFHRIIRGFMIQGGDPNSKDADPNNDGMGGPGYSIPDEVNGTKHERGVLSMAHAGPNTAGSQFFVCHGEAPHLDKDFTAFGRVIDGLDTLDRIASVPVTRNAQGEAQVPTVEVIVHRALVIVGK